MLTLSRSVYNNNEGLFNAAGNAEQGVYKHEINSATKRPGAEGFGAEEAGVVFELVVTFAATGIRFLQQCNALIVA